MKKLLSILSLLTISSTTMPSVTATSIYEKEVQNLENLHRFKRGNDSTTKPSKTDETINNNDIINTIIKLLNITDDNYLKILNSDKIQKIINNSLKLEFFLNSLVEIFNLLLIKFTKEEYESIECYQMKLNKINLIKEDKTKMEFEELDNLIKKIYVQFEEIKNKNWLKIDDLKNRMINIEKWLKEKNKIFTLNKKSDDNIKNTDLDFKKIKYIKDINFSSLSKIDLNNIIKKIGSYEKFVNILNDENKNLNFNEYLLIQTNFTRWSNFVIGAMIFSNDFNKKTILQDFSKNINSVEKKDIFKSALKNYEYILEKLLQNDLNKLIKDNFSNLDEVNKKYEEKIKKTENKLIFKKTMKINKLIEEKKQYEKFLYIYFKKNKKNIENKFNKLSKKTSFIKNILKKQEIDNENNGFYDVPSDGSCLFWSIVSAFLLPVRNNNEEFKNKFIQLFGELKLSYLSYVQSLLQQFDVTNHSSTQAWYQNQIVNNLITNIFRNRVVNYIETNLDTIANVSSGLTFRDLIQENNEISNNYLERIREQVTWGGIPEIISITNILNANISINNDFPYQPINQNSINTINIFFVNGNHYNFGLENQNRTGTNANIQPANISNDKSKFKKEGGQLQLDNINKILNKPITTNIKNLQATKNKTI